MFNAFLLLLLTHYDCGSEEVQCRNILSQQLYKYLVPLFVTQICKSCQLMLLCRGREKEKAEKVIQTDCCSFSDIKQEKQSSKRILSAMMGGYYFVS